MEQFRNLLLAALMCLIAGIPAAAATFVGDRDDFRDETIYFAMTTRFYDGDPTNNVCGWDHQSVQIENNDPDWRGDFAGLIEKLDYIKALGFTAIWITPVVQNCSGTDFHGYHAMDFTSVDLRYESRTEWGASKDVKFQDLIDAAHAKGLKIILDVVLQHTGNFGEVNLNPLFERDQNIKNQASVPASLIVNTDRLSSNYFDQDGKAQYNERWKYFKNPEYEPNNYYHHYGTGWNWDLPNRWWGQIAGDCVDLNTENDHVAQYIVDCYGKFIEMGVDGFRIDTTGHISPLTFNKQFIPQFVALGEKYKNKRLNGCKFYMFGECCQRYQGSIVYRGQPNLSSYFYTWKSDEALLNEFNGDPAWWRQQVLPEGHDTPVGPMAVCEKDTKDKPRSNNAWMQGGAWHEPDYSQASGFNVIDFPVHYSFNSVSSVMGLFGMDNYYNDATYNVVYVDSHDYCPGPNDLTRFNGGTAQWAENLSLMFTFRGIPCIYYGSEVEFKKGMKVDAGGTDNPVKDSGRAYFGNYIEGNVTASDFGEFTASGNVAKTLDADLAQHIIRLNKIRAAVPALRKGQYTFDGCSANGGWAYKRAYKDSYALVALNGGASFTSVPNGTYVDIVTGQSYNVTGGSVTVTAPEGKGQLRVLVKDWKGGKVGEDGKFIYTDSPVAHGGDVTFEDPGTTQYYTADDAVGRPAVKFSPAGGSFKTETLSVTATLNEAAKTGWYQVAGSEKVNLAPGESKSFTIGANMAFGESVTVNWGADDKYTGKATYRKVDPNAVITVYVTAPSAPNIYAWEGASKFAGEWPGTKMTDTQEIGGRTFYYMSFPDVEESLNVIFNNGSAQTNDITGITSDVYFEYDGGTNATKIDAPGPVKPVIKANPASGKQFNDKLVVTLTVSPATDIYYTIDGTPATAASAKYNGAITITNTTTINAYAKNEVGETHASFTYTKTDAPVTTEWHAYFENTNNWGTVNAYCWDDKNTGDNAFSGKWPGKQITETIVFGGKTLYHYHFIPEEELVNPMIIFNGNGVQTHDLVLYNNGIYNRSGFTNSYVQSGIDAVETDDNAPVEYYTIQGIRVAEPQAAGVYIMRKGSKVSKIYVR